MNYSSTFQSKPRSRQTTHIPALKTVQAVPLTWHRDHFQGIYIRIDPHEIFVHMLATSWRCCCCWVAAIRRDRLSTHARAKVFGSNASKWHCSTLSITSFRFPHRTCATSHWQPLWSHQQTNLSTHHDRWLCLHMHGTWEHTALQQTVGCTCALDKTKPTFTSEVLDKPMGNAIKKRGYSHNFIIVWINMVNIVKKTCLLFSQPNWWSF